MSRSYALTLTLSILVAALGTCCSGDEPDTTEDASTAGGSDAGSTSAVDSGPGPTPGTDAGPRPGPGPVGAWFDNPRAGASMFVSGHSLIDRVFGWWPAENGGPASAIALGAGKDHYSLLQSGAGSTAGLRREDILTGRQAEPDWARFDTSIVLERSDLAGSIIYEDSFDNLGWFADRILNAAPGGDEIYFYQTWWGYRDAGRVTLDNYAEWSEYTRAELPLAECVAERLGRERRHRVRVIPAATAVNELMALADRGEADGLSIPELWADGAHLSDVAHTYLAMVIFATIYRTPTAGLTIPDISPSRAAFFAELADRFVANYYDNYSPPTAAECRAAFEDMCRRGEVGPCNGATYFSDSLYGAPVE